MKKIIPALLLTAFAAFDGAAQLHENIAVEGDYIPDIIRRDRLNTLPATERFSLDTEPLSFERAGVATPFAPSLLTMPASVWHGARIPRSNRGYVSAALGSWLNSDLSAGYRPLDTDRSQLGAWLQFNSTSLWKPYHYLGDTPLKDIRRELYDGTGGLYASHTFDGLGTLSASVDYRCAWFNYFGAPQMADETSASTPSQTLNGVKALVEWDNRRTADPAVITYAIAADVNYNAFRRIYTPAGNYRGQRETLAGFEGAFRIPWADGASRLGADARLDLAFYSNAKDIPLTYQADNYANFRLTPYYNFVKEGLSLRAGLDLEFTSGAGTADDRFPLLHVAPDVRVDWSTKGVSLFAHFLGGNRLNTLAGYMALSPYLEPYLHSTRPTYSPLDAEAGVSAGPFEGFTATLSAGYKIVRRAPLLGWYLEELPSGDGAPELHRAPELHNAPELHGLSTQGWKVAFDAEYSFGKLLKLQAGTAWMPRKNAKGYFDNLDRAKYVITAKAEFRPIENLTVTLSYNLRAGREFFAEAAADPVGSADLAGNSDIRSGAPASGTTIIGGQASGGTTVVGGEGIEYLGVRVPNISTLGLRAEWNVTRAFSVFAFADNLLCRRDVLLPAVVAPRLTAAAGLSFKF